MTFAGDDRHGVTLREQAYGAFTHRLLARELAPGQFISQRELVLLTEMPLGAIRELIPRLEAEGLIRTVPQRGMQIAHLDVTLIRDAYQFRLFLELGAIVEFTQSVTDAELARLRRQHEAIVEKAAEGVSAALIAEAQAVDWGFHDTLIDALGNAIVSNAYRVNSIKIRLIRQQLSRLDHELVVPVIREHLRILDAIETRVPTAAVAALTKHLQDARSRSLGM